jgi:HTH-type transcriptional regulator/antitoxin HipB
MLHKSFNSDILLISPSTDIAYSLEAHIPMDYSIRLADQLKAHLRSLRKQRGLTQAQLGKRLGVGQVRIAEIEAKPGLVSVDQLVKLLSALGAGLVVRDLQGGSAAPVARPVPEPASSAPGAAGRKKPGAVAGKTRGAAPGLRITAKKGSW